MPPQREIPKKALISIADVLKTGKRMSTEDRGVVRYLVPELEVAVSALPATDQGGDFYGVVFLGGGRTALFIGDVAGHDFSSTIPATEAVKYFDDHREKLIYPHLFLKELNRKMFKMLNSIGRFLTIAVCVLDTENNVLSYASAGHPPALHVVRESGVVDEVGEKMLPVGFEDDLSFKLVQKDFMPGDSVLFYTDGLSSARNSDKEEFGSERLKDLLSANSCDAHGALLKIIETHKDFCMESPETDDCTVICVRRAE